MSDDIKASSKPSVVSPEAGFRVVVIGASAGGIPALNHILWALPPEFGAAIAVVQHRTGSVRSMLAQVIGRSCPFPVWDAREGDSLRPGIVYLAPPDRHLTVGHGGILSLDQSERLHFVRPSAEKLFVSAAEHLKSRVIAVVLSGEGTDGEFGVRFVKRMGGTVIAQDEGTSEQFGMPQAAIRAGVVDYVLPLDSIGPALMKLVIDTSSMVSGPQHGATAKAILPSDYGLHAPDASPADRERLNCDATYSKLDLFSQRDQLR